MGPFFQILIFCYLLFWFVWMPKNTPGSLNIVNFERFAISQLKNFAWNFWFSSETDFLHKKSYMLRCSIGWLVGWMWFDTKLIGWLVGYDLIRLFVTRWGKGGGTVLVIGIQKVQVNTRQHCWTKLPFKTCHKSLEGVLLPESPPRVLRDPPLIQCLVTLSHTYIRTWCLAQFLA